jgi:hypothetical protein
LVEPLGEAAAKEGMVFNDENVDFFHESDSRFSLAMPTQGGGKRQMTEVQSAEPD